MTGSDRYIEGIGAVSLARRAHLSIHSSFLTTTALEAGLRSNNMVLWLMISVGILALASAQGNGIPRSVLAQKNGF